jgi:hypothetical protein
MLDSSSRNEVTAGFTALLAVAVNYRPQLAAEFVAHLPAKAGTRYNIFSRWRR